MAKLKISSVDAKAVLQCLEGTAVGGDFELPSLFPGLPDSTIVRIESEGNRNWVVQLIALGVQFTRMNIRVDGNELVMEELK